MAIGTPNGGTSGLRPHPRAECARNPRRDAVTTRDTSTVPLRHSLCAIQSRRSAPGWFLLFDKRQRPPVGILSVGHPRRHTPFVLPVPNTRVPGTLSPLSG